MSKSQTWKRYEAKRLANKKAKNRMRNKMGRRSRRINRSKGR